MFRFLSSMLTCAALCYGSWWLWNNNPSFRQIVGKYLETGSFPTLEARYTAEQIMETHRKDLLKTPQHTYLESSLRFYPYALMEVKYSQNDASTAEGVILWGLEDGEMVIDVATWSKTHGLQDCVNSRADKAEYRLLLTLSKFGGSADRGKIMNALHMENEALDMIVESCRRKKLLVQNGNHYRLHFQQPLLHGTPETKLDRWLVTKPYHEAQRVPARYSLGQVEEASYQLFTNDFSVRNISEIYLPVYTIVVQNPDGSLFTSYWNALNGKRFNHSLLPER